MIIRRIAFCALLAACLPVTAPAQQADRVPDDLGDGWAVARPVDAGLDPDALEALAERIDAGPFIPNVHALLIEHEGRLVFERYWPGDDLGWDRPLGRVAHGPTTLHNLRSVTKSVTSLLLGIALGKAAPQALSRPFVNFFPEQASMAQGVDAITLHHALTMTAGLAWNETLVPYDNPRNDLRQLGSTDDPVGYMFSKDLGDSPGRRWTYNTGLTDLTGGVIQTLTGMPLAGFADKVLFGPLGITEYEWHRPDAWGADGFPSAGAGLRMRARDLAKIGSLVLQGGLWQGRRIVPEDWIEVSTARHVQDVPWGPPGVYGYGYYWFPGTLLSGQRVIAAFGSGDQRVLVLPEAGLSITIFAGNYGDCCSGIDQVILGRIVRALD